MNQLVRNLGVVLFGVASSLVTAAVLIFVEARTGQALFGYSLWTYVPVGAIGAGLVAALGYAAGALLLRSRPARVILPAIVLVAVGTVFVAESAEFAMFMGAQGETRSAAAFGQFLMSAVAQSPLKFGGSSSSDDASSGSGAPMAEARAVPAATSGDSRVEGIGQGVSGMLATPDVTNSATAHRLTAMDDHLQSMGKSLESHNLLLTITALQIAGFAMGALLVYSFLRRRCYCEECSTFLSKKGEQVRYFENPERMQASANGFILRMKERKLRESIADHSVQGSPKGTRFAEYASSIEIRRCTSCERHRVKFAARRKKGGSWKDIPVLGQEAFTLESLDVVRG